MRKQRLIKDKLFKRERRHKRIRKKIFGTFQKPRLVVYKSLKHMYAQVINDEEGITICAASTLKMERKQKKEMAHEVGKIIGAECLKKNIKKVCFDRNGFKYHGRVKRLADGAREAGLEF